MTLNIITPMGNHLRWENMSKEAVQFFCMMYPKHWVEV